MKMLSHFLCCLALYQGTCCPTVCAVLHHSNEHLFNTPLLAALYGRLVHWYFFPLLPALRARNRNKNKSLHNPIFWWSYPGMNWFSIPAPRAPRATFCHWLSDGTRHSQKLPSVLSLLPPPHREGAWHSGKTWRPQSVWRRIITACRRSKTWLSGPDPTSDDALSSWRHRGNHALGHSPVAVVPAVICQHSLPCCQRQQDLQADTVQAISTRTAAFPPGPKDWRRSLNLSLFRYVRLLGLSMITFHLVISPDKGTLSSLRKPLCQRLSTPLLPRAEYPPKQNKTS